MVKAIHLNALTAKNKTKFARTDGAVEQILESIEVAALKGLGYFVYTVTTADFDYIMSVIKELGYVVDVADGNHSGARQITISWMN